MPILAIPLLLLLPPTATAALAEERARLPRPPDGVADALVGIAHALELAGVAAILAGVLWAVGQALLRLVREGPNARLYAQARTDLGRGILFGLELLIAADIIGTVVIEPTLSNLAVLAGIVVIRTFLSFALEAELRGLGPWRRSGRPPPEGAG